MYRGFNIDISYENSNDYVAGLKLVTEHKAFVNRELSEYLAPNGAIDGAKLQSDWFPKINADIFISHSHKDEKLAITLLGWLQKHFGIIAFVDSTIWGYSDTLLKKIDNAYCLNNGGQTYSYEKRNNSTAHVHMMLSTALSRMMDYTECLFFLNTPNSLSTEGVIHSNETNSPWIYYEIGISGLIRKPLSKHTNRATLLKSKQFSEQILNESKRAMDVRYPLQLSHLTEIKGPDLNRWKNEYLSEIPKAEYALDKLYSLY